MTICREEGSPNLLITFTMDPDCPELKKMLGPGQQWYDRPDLVCRLFIDKQAEFRKDLTEKEVMGPVKAWFSAVEHQKRFNKNYGSMLNICIFIVAFRMSIFF